MCFTKHTLNKHNLGRLGLKPRSGPLSFFFWGGLGLAQPTWVGLDPAWSLAPSQWPGWAAGTRGSTHACTAWCKGNYLRTIFVQQLHRNKEKKKTLPSEAEGESEGNSAGTGWRMLSFSSSFQSLLPLFLVFFCSLLCFLTFVVSPVFLLCFFSPFFFLYIISPLCAYTEICIYSVRVPSCVRNKVSIKLILFFEIWIWLRIKFESG
jgi:hypothetical protein